MTVPFKIVSRLYKAWCSPFGRNFKWIVWRQDIGPAGWRIWQDTSYQYYIFFLSLHNLIYTLVCASGSQRHIRLLAISSIFEWSTYRIMHFILLQLTNLLFTVTYFSAERRRQMADTLPLRHKRISALYVLVSSAARTCCHARLSLLIVRKNRRWSEAVIKNTYF
jgi:hypothetical protein